MKNKLILTLALFAITSCANGQLAIITPTTQNITIAWEHTGLDSIGSPESMSHFNIYLRHNLGATIKIGVTAADTLEYDVVLPDTTGKYILGVSAVDVAYNESSIHWSTDSTGAFEGWYLLWDIIAPAVPFGLIRIK